MRDNIGTGLTLYLSEMHLDNCPLMVHTPQHIQTQMLSDFIDDTAPGLSKADKAKAVKEMDIAVVSEQYDKEIRNAVRNVFSGT